MISTGSATESLLVFRLARAWRRRPPGPPGLGTALAVALFLAARFAPATPAGVAQWALGRRLIGEGGVEGLASFLSAAWVASIAVGLIGSWRLLAWVMYGAFLILVSVAWGLCRWTPTRLLIMLLDRLVAGVLVGVGAVATLVARALVSVGRLLWLVGSTTFRAVRRGLTAGIAGLVLGLVAVLGALASAARGLGRALSLVGRALGKVVGWMLRPVGVALRLVALLASRALRIVAQGCRLGVRLAVAGIALLGLILRALGGVARAIALPLISLLVAVADAGKSLLRSPMLKLVLVGAGAWLAFAIVWPTVLDRPNLFARAASNIALVTGAPEQLFAAIGGMSGVIRFAGWMGGVVILVGGVWLATGIWRTPWIRNPIIEAAQGILTPGRSILVLLLRALVDGAELLLVRPVLAAIKLLSAAVVLGVSFAFGALRAGGSLLLRPIGLGVRALAMAGVGFARLLWLGAWTIASVANRAAQVFWLAARAIPAACGRPLRAAVGAIALLSVVAVRWTWRGTWWVTVGFAHLIRGVALGTAAAARALGSVLAQAMAGCWATLRLLGGALKLVAVILIAPLALIVRALGSVARAIALPLISLLVAVADAGKSLLPSRMLKLLLVGAVGVWLAFAIVWPTVLDRPNLFATAASYVALVIGGAVILVGAVWLATGIWRTHWIRNPIVEALRRILTLGRSVLVLWLRSLVDGAELLLVRPVLAAIKLLSAAVVLGVGLAFGALGAGGSLLLRSMGVGVRVLAMAGVGFARLLWLGACTIASVTAGAVAFAAGSFTLAARAAAASAGPAPDFLPRPLWLVVGTLFFAVQSVVGLVPLAVQGGTTGVLALAGPPRARFQPRQEVAAMSMSKPSMSRESLVGVVVLIWVIGAIIGLVVLWPKEPEPVVVNHWGNVYMGDARMLPGMSKQFNDARHRVASGRRIEIRPFFVNSGLIAEELISRATTGQPSGTCLEVPGGCEKPDLPTIVTPANEHWFPYINYRSRQTVIDKTETHPLATSYVGIAMQREMAKCLGWPDREVGIADVVALRHDPRGWTVCPTAKTEWGRQPLLAFTDPDSSSTARSVLYSLYGIAAGKSPEALTEADARNPDVVEYIKDFQRAVDHYVPSTDVLATKMAEGPRFGHFFFFPENNFVSLQQGRLPITVLGKSERRPLGQDMVMVYPKEGSPSYRQSAAIVQASWVGAEEREAALKWVAFLREDAQQRVMAEHGFRPATSVPWDDIRRQHGLDLGKPAVIINPDNVDQAAAQVILNSWGEVKKPGIVMFVVDTSGSMAGNKMDQAKQGMLRVLDTLAVGNLVGFLTFSDQVNARVGIGPVNENKYGIRDAVEAMRPSGRTALYDAIADAIRMADAAEPELEAIRGVVVLTDGKANRGQRLDQLISMQSTEERPVRDCPGFESSRCTDQTGREIKMGDVLGTGLALRTTHPVHIFYVGVGSDADLEVGRLVAMATASAYRRATETNLASVLETFGRYF